MELPEILDFLQGAEQRLREIATRHTANSATREDATTVLSFRAKLDDTDLEKRVAKLLRRAKRRDPETNKPLFRAAHIEEVEKAAQLLESVAQLTSGAMFEELQALEAQFQAEEQEQQAEKQRLRVEEEERKRAAAAAEAKEREEEERVERERVERERQAQFEETAQRFEAMKDPLEKLRDQELLRMRDVTPGVKALGKALALLEPPVRRSSLTLLSETFLTNIVRSPDKKEFFRINVENPKFQSDVLGVKGCTEVLIAIGFGIVLEIHEDEESMAVTRNLYYILSEPEVAPGEMDLDKLDEWERWYNKQKLYLAVVDHATDLNLQQYDTFHERLASMSPPDVARLYELPANEHKKALKALSSP